MELIDKYALLRNLEAACDDYRKEMEDFGECADCAKDIFDEAIDVVLHAQVIEDTSVHGRWVEKSYVLCKIGMCSVCGRTCEIPEHEKFDYCPNCGAKMDL